MRLVSNAQTNNIKGIISTAQSHAKAQVNDIGFKKSFYVDGEPTSPTLRHNYFMENDWLSEFQKYFFRTLGAASGLVAIPIAIGLGWLLLIFGSNIARNPELRNIKNAFRK